MTANTPVGPAALPPADSDSGFGELRGGNLGVRIATSAAEIDAVQALRYRVFYAEMGAVPGPETARTQRDRDRFDEVADHLLVVDHAIGPGAEGVVGTYRLIQRPAAERMGGFYSADEYDISPLIEFPGRVLELASRLLPEAAPDVTPTEAVRPGRSEPRLISAEGRLLESVCAEVAEQHRSWPTVAVIAPAGLAGPVLEALRSHDGLPPGVVGHADDDGLGRPVTVVASEGAKGLEFDAVVVVEPSAIAAERDDPMAGLRLLYVALTRPTQHLSIVADRPLPPALVS